MDARDIVKEIKLVAGHVGGSPKSCAKISSETVFDVTVGKTTYHFKDVTGFKIQNWVQEINTVINELTSWEE